LELFTAIDTSTREAPRLHHIEFVIFEKSPSPRGEESMRSNIATIITNVVAIIGLSFICLHSQQAEANVSPDNEMTSRIQRYDYYSSHYPSFVRISVLGGAGAGEGGGNTKSNDSSRVGYTGGVLADFGRSMFTVETGVLYLNSPVVVSFADPLAESSQISHAMKLNYVGVPAIVKFNYIERPQASFSLKLGVMQAWLVGTEGAPETLSSTALTESTIETKDLINNTDTMGIAGFTGSAPITDNLAFLIDGTYFHGFNEITSSGSHNRAFLLSVGLRFNL
jgi:hypothetical protein